VNSWLQEDKEAAGEAGFSMYCAPARDTGKEKNKWKAKFCCYAHLWMKGNSQILKFFLSDSSVSASDNIKALGWLISILCVFN
jgi:hypothetical protein